jgi:hypothetical protein
MGLSQFMMYHFHLVLRISLPEKVGEVSAPFTGKNFVGTVIARLKYSDLIAH